MFATALAQFVILYEGQDDGDFGTVLLATMREAPPCDRVGSVLLGLWVALVVKHALWPRSPRLPYLGIQAFTTCRLAQQRDSCSELSFDHVG